MGLVDQLLSPKTQRLVQETFQIRRYVPNTRAFDSQDVEVTGTGWPAHLRDLPYPQSQVPHLALHASISPYLSKHKQLPMSLHGEEYVQDQDKDPEGPRLQGWPNASSL